MARGHRTHRGRNGSGTAYIAVATARQLSLLRVDYVRALALQDSLCITSLIVVFLLVLNHFYCQHNASLVVLALNDLSEGTLSDQLN